MDLFFYETGNMDLETEKKKLIQKWNDYCTDSSNNPLLVGIQEIKNRDELKRVCRLLNSLSTLLREIDPVGENCNYAVYFGLLADAIKSNEIKTGGGETSLNNNTQIRKFGLDDFNLK